MQSRVNGLRRWAGVATLALLPAITAAACGGSAQPAPQLAPSEQAPTPALTTADEAGQALDAAEQQLRQLIAPPDSYAQPPATGPQPPGTAAGVDSPAPPPPAQPTAEMSAADRCSIACRALASMSRAAERLCELTGEDDDRCVSARARVTAAEELIYRSCPSC